MHYLIIGNGVAGITAAFTIRKRDAICRITVISGESEYFISRTALMYAYMDRMTLRDLEPYERKTYKVQRIELVCGWVVNWDTHLRVLRLGDGREITYDRLLLAVGSVPNRIDWPGLEQVKEGAVHFVSLENLAECERLTPSTRHAVVVGGGLIGVELVECLTHHGIEVDFLVREGWYFPMALGKEEGDLIAQHIQRHGVRLHLEQEVASVSADAAGRIAAVRTEQGQEFTCEMLGICIGVRPGIDWLKRAATPLELGRGIKVSPSFKTSVPDVWAAGDCAEFALPDGSELIEQIWYSAKRQGELAGLAMLGDAVDYQPPLFYNSAKFFDIEYTTCGEVTRIPSDAVSFFYRLPGKESSIRVIEHSGEVIGFNMLGSRWDHKWFEKWIRERRSMREVISQLHLAQFDVEFGRMPLSGVRKAFGEFRN